MKYPLLFTFLMANVALANSYSVSVIEIPRPESVVAFTNGFPLATGTRQIKNKEDILEFLKGGVYARKTLSVEEQMILKHKQEKITDQDGKFYLWTQITPSLLWLQTPEGGGAVLELKSKK